MSTVNQLRPLFALFQQGQLQDYVTALIWSSRGDCLAMASAAGEVVLIDPSGNQQILLEAQDSAIDTLQFSADGHWLAAAGQAGTLYCWGIRPEAIALAWTLEHAGNWIDQLAWHPTEPLLAFGVGRYVQIGDIPQRRVIATLPCEKSSALGLAWHPQGDWLAVGAQQAIKLWSGSDWNAAPQTLEMVSACVSLAVSPEGEYIASGNLDRTLLVWQQGKWEQPWRMQGFSGKVRQVAWSMPRVGTAPLLACASGESVVLWKKQSQDEMGWEPRMLELHQARVEAIDFHPKSLLLASAAADGFLGLWRKGRLLTQILEGTSQGFSTLAWHPSGQLLAAGGQAGEWLVWKAQRSGKGFA